MFSGQSQSRTHNNKNNTGLYCIFLKNQNKSSMFTFLDVFCHTCLLVLCRNRNLQAAIGAYYDFESPNVNTPSMSFVEDVTIGEGESVPPDTPFTKTWRIQNTGVAHAPTFSCAYSISPRSTALLLLNGLLIAPMFVCSRCRVVAAWG